MMAPQPRQGGGFARAILTTLATSIFGLSLLLNLYLIVIVASTQGGSTREDVIISGDPQQKVAIIPVSGIIMSESSARFGRLLRAIEADSAVKALVIEVDSTGGTVTASDEIYNEILRYRKARPNVPVVISMASVAASGGYYVACATDWIFAQPTTITGSIGVVLPSFNVSKMIEKWGVSENSIVATGADYKTAGSGFHPDNPEERKYFQQLADSMFTRFKMIVTNARAKKLTQPLEVVANGKIFTGEEAKDLGLVDQIGYLEDAWDYAAGQAKLTSKTVVRVQEKMSLLGALSGQSNAINPGAKLTVNGVNVNIDSNLVSEMLTSRPMYLWRGQ